MNAQAPYIMRPLATEGSLRPDPARALLSFAVRASCKFIPTWIMNTIGEQSRRLTLLREEGESAMPKSPIEGMMVESVEKIPDNEPPLVSRLIGSFVAAKEQQRESPRPYLPGGDWKALLESEWGKYQEAISQQNLEVIAPFLRNFFRNEGLSGFWGGKQMFEIFACLDGIDSLQRARLMRRQFETWRSLLPGAPVDELDAPRIGNPWGYIVNGKLLYEPVCEYHYQANYFGTLLSEVSAPVILEIGGGFGGLGYQIVKRIPHVKYIGFDLPENVLLQSYYLSCAFPGKNILTYDKAVTALTKDDIAKYDIILMPNFMIPNMESAVADLVINVRSLSEMPTETISEYHQQIDRLSRFFFFHENIFKKRLDNWHGIASSEFPALRNLMLLAESESRWPRYDKDSGYPCHENLYIHKSATIPVCS